MKTFFALIALVATVACVVLPVQRNALSCKMCKLAVKKYEESADKDVETIKKDFDAECKTLFHSIPFAPKECEHYVDSKIDPIIKELEGGTAPKDVCTAINEC